MTRVGVCSVCDEIKWLNVSSVCEVCVEEIKMMIRSDVDGDSKQ